jgi:hypothetical protein
MLAIEDNPVAAPAYPSNDRRPERGAGGETETSKTTEASNGKSPKTNRKKKPVAS